MINTSSSGTITRIPITRPATIHNKIYSKDYPMDYPEPEAIVAAIMHLGRVKEIPVQMRAREAGTSSITFKKSIYYMIKVTLAILICRMSYGIRRAKREAR